NWMDPPPLYDDSTWAAARLVAPVGGYPWTELRLRSLPLLVEREVPLTLIETRRSTSSPLGLLVSADAHLALREGWFAATPQPDSAQDSGWFRVSAGVDEAVYWLFDLER